jgi:hypothetical protein
MIPYGSFAVTAAWQTLRELVLAGLCKSTYRSTYPLEQLLDYIVHGQPLTA